MKLLILNLITVLTFALITGTTLAADSPLSSNGLANCDGSSEIQKEYDEDGNEIEKEFGIYTLNGVQAFLCGDGSFNMSSAFGPVEGQLDDKEFSATTITIVVQTSAVKIMPPRQSTDFVVGVKLNLP